MEYVKREEKKGRPRFLTDEDVDKMVKAFNEGSSKAELAEYFNISVDSVRRYLNERKR